MASERGLCGVYLVAESAEHSLATWVARHARGSEVREDAGYLAPVAAELNEYADGARRAFTLELDLRGTPFQRAVWDALVRLPYGATTTYGELARRLGRPRASRAVGAANGANPVPIVVPCHRVVGTAGMTGFGGGLELKRRLLALEGALLPLA